MNSAHFPSIDPDRTGSFKISHVSHTPPEPPNFSRADLGKCLPALRQILDLVLGSLTPKGLIPMRKPPEPIDNLLVSRREAQEHLFPTLQGVFLPIVPQNKLPDLVRRQTPHPRTRW